MLLRTIARIACFVVAAAAGWAVYVNLKELFSLWVSVGGGAGVFVTVYCLLYFPLARHIADAITDRMSVMVHRGRHIRAGSGVDFIPAPPKAINCNICGGPGGPICPKCDSELNDHAKHFR